MMDDIAVFKQLSLAEQLSRVARLWRTVADRKLTSLGLTHSRWTVLWKLKTLNDHVSQKTLANALEIELASLMRTLSQLESHGLIVRDCCESDKRVRIVSFTENGIALMTQVEGRILALRRNILANIDEAALTQFETVLETITHNALHQLNDNHVEIEESVT
ncbi:MULTISPECIES: MarR family transcriptional regulator [unclassified Agarivorans]|uniref:MarR family transcriptional regulator n=1 Tax=unclassified Agarivorans TaxID=2636026 RepID=UPI003D7C700C